MTARMDKGTLARAALPAMRSLNERCGETVGLAVLDGKARMGLIVESVQGTRHRFSFTLTPGTRFPLHTGAPAKAMLAFLPAARQHRMLQGLVFTRYTAKTITSRQAFLKELAAIRKQGFALDCSEEIEGCHCVAAPVCVPEGAPVAAIWITGPASRLSIQNLHAAAPRVMDAAEEISGVLRDTTSPATLPDNEALIRRAERFLAANLTGRIDWLRLSADLGASYSKLRHLFAEQVGIPPARYHLQLRLEEAKRLLREGELTIQEIAQRTGFCDPNHFSALFSRTSGSSPTHYRRAQLSGEQPVRRRA
jgi:DNA-binding IclR family transcriptional regulator